MSPASCEPRERASGIPRQRLQQAIQAFSAQGYQIIAQTDTTAQMKRPRQFSALVAILLLIFTFGLLLIAYILLYAAQKEQLIFIAVSDNGAIDVTGDVTDRVFYALRELNER